MYLQTYILGTIFMIIVFCGALKVVGTPWNTVGIFAAIIPFDRDWETQ